MLGRGYFPVHPRARGLGWRRRHCDAACGRSFSPLGAQPQMTAQTLRGHPGSPSVPDAERMRWSGNWRDSASRLGSSSTKRLSKADPNPPKPVLNNPRPSKIRSKSSSSWSKSVRFRTRSVQSPVQIHHKPDTCVHTQSKLIQNPSKAGQDPSTTGPNPSNGLHPSEISA